MNPIRKWFCKRDGSSSRGAHPKDALGCEQWCANAAFHPALLPSPSLMRREGIDVLEDWFRWAEEWSVLLRIYGKLTPESAVLEIGCGLGRIAFALRFVLSKAGSYFGFDICKYKIEFLEETFQQVYPNFRFIWSDIRNTTYNPCGLVDASVYRFPSPENSFDLVYAASVFTHMLPEGTANYLRETSRVLKPGGRCVFSFFMLDNYRRGQKRPLSFNSSYFNLDYPYGGYGDEFAVAQPQNPEDMTGYKAGFLQRLARQAGLRLIEPPLEGMWSGTARNWIGVQDVMVLGKCSDL